MTKSTLRTVFAIFLGSTGMTSAAMRPPAVPLITHDPYFSLWSTGDKLTDGPTKHWTGVEQSMEGFVRVDGKALRFMGHPGRRREPALPALEQTSVEVMPTRTTYHFTGAGILLELTFLTPALPQDLAIMSRPISYLIWNVRSADSAQHQCELYFDASSQLATNTPDEATNWSRFQTAGMNVLRVGTQTQPVLQKAGDNVRIDWGYAYLAIPPEEKEAVLSANKRNVTEQSFMSSGVVPAGDDLETDTARRNGAPVLAVSIPFGRVGATPVSHHVMLAYDDRYSIEYFHRWLRPYWAKDGQDFAGLLGEAARDFPALQTRCAEFDQQLMSDLTKAGGDAYAALCALAYRQTIAAHKLTVDVDGTPLFFSKENFSNGSIDTVDITYPSSPFFLLFNPELLKAQLRPIMDYSNLKRWKFPFAPHDLGVYPQANGQQYGGKEESEENQMPVEESGNMLIMFAALAKAEGNAKFAAEYWPVLSKWADYLREKGLDPENQLSTDDFAGHLAHNANLSIKAIEALGFYARLAKTLGKNDVAATYEKTAKEYATKWISMAKDGDHYKLAFERPGTWSQKYNLVWDTLLGLNLFPASIAKEELASYGARINKYGLPLDNRADYTKLDWTVWTASLTKTKPEFEKLVEPLLLFANETSDRVPLSDWYNTKTAKQEGFQARSVVGGIFIQMLDNPQVWQKYVAAAAAR